MRAVITVIGKDNVGILHKVSGVLCQIRYITMHLTVHFDMFYDLFAIGFQSAVEVVQVFDA